MNEQYSIIFKKKLFYFLQNDEHLSFNIVRYEKLCHPLESSFQVLEIIHNSSQHLSVNQMHLFYNGIFQLINVRVRGHKHVLLNTPTEKSQERTGTTTEAVGHPEGNDYSLPPLTDVC